MWPDVMGSSRGDREVGGEKEKGQNLKISPIYLLKPLTHTSCSAAVTVMILDSGP